MTPTFNFETLAFVRSNFHSSGNVQETESNPKVFSHQGWEDGALFLTHSILSALRLSLWHVRDGMQRDLQLPVGHMWQGDREMSGLSLLPVRGSQVAQQDVCLPHRWAKHYMVTLVSVRSTVKTKDRTWCWSKRACLLCFPQGKDGQSSSLVAFAIFKPNLIDNSEGTMGSHKVYHILMNQQRQICHLKNRPTKTGKVLWTL